MNRASSDRTLKEPEGTAGKILAEFGVDQEKLMELIGQLVAAAPGETALKEPKDPQYSPRSRKILEQALEDAESMECTAGTEHILLALLKETDCVGTRLLLQWESIYRSFSLLF
ncbi:MAG: Clp protease N-terminal domain-containing protein [Blautia wexlerae]